MRTIISALVTVIILGNFYFAPKNVVAYNTNNLNMISSAMVDKESTKTLGQK